MQFLYFMPDESASDKGRGRTLQRDLKGLLVFIVSGLVDYPDDISVKEVETERSTILEVKVNQADVGKVIGKNGRIIKAIRLVLKAAGVHAGKSVAVELTN